MEIYVISLERSPDRKQTFDSYNSKYIDNYIYYEAVDGSQLDISKLDKSVYDKKSTGYSNGAIGVALSHLKLWEKCIELNKPIIIMEDDVIVSRDFNKHLNNVLNMLPEDYDILQLSYNFNSVLCYKNTIYENCNSIFGKKKMTNYDIENFRKDKIYPTIAKLNYSFGLASYIISPKGARMLKATCFPLNNRILNLPFLGAIKSYTIDCMMNYVYKELSAYICIIPFVITPHISDDYKSTIS